MKKEEISYISGFLDGDGCIMLQLVFRKDYILGYQIRASIVFYQNSRHRLYLEWLKKKLTHGYIRNRNDGMCEYTIVGVEQVKSVLEIFYPYLKLKKLQADLALKIFRQMPDKGKRMNPKLLLKLAKEVDKFAILNYSKKRTNTSLQVEDFLKTHKLLIP